MPSVTSMINFIKSQEITFETKNKFSFKIQKEKIRELAYTSQIDLETISLSPEDSLLKNYFLMCMVII